MDSHSLMGLICTNMLILGRLMTLTAYTRQETRGTHLRTDFPDRDDRHWQRHIDLHRDAELDDL